QIFQIAGIELAVFGVLDPAVDGGGAFEDVPLERIFRAAGLGPVRGQDLLRTERGQPSARRGPHQPAILPAPCAPARLAPPCGRRPWAASRSHWKSSP